MHRRDLLNLLRDPATLVEMLGLATKADVGSLRKDAALMKSDMAQMKADLQQVKMLGLATKADVGSLRGDMAQMKADMAQMKTDLQHDISRAVGTIGEMLADSVGAVDERYADLPQRVARLENIVLR